MRAIVTAVTVRRNNSQTDLRTPTHAVERRDQLLLPTLEPSAELVLVRERLAEAGGQHGVIRRRERLDDLRVREDLRLGRGPRSVTRIADDRIDPVGDGGHAERHAVDPSRAGHVGWVRYERV